MNTTPTPEHQSGFVLITSLIFLVVVTLLAVSAINSSTLQEKIATNTRAREIAHEQANAALRQGEQLLADQLFDSYRVPGTTVQVTIQTLNNEQELVETSGVDLKIWTRGGMFGTSAGTDATETQKDDVTRFLTADGVWENAKPMTYALSGTAKGSSTVEYYVAEYAFNGRDLNPDTAATADGTAIYRVTARAEGQGGAAVAVTQSRYAKNY